MSDPIDRAIGGTTLDESVKALQDVFVDHDPAEKGEPMSDLIDRQAAITAICEDGTWLERQGCNEITLCERKQRDADILSELPTIEAEPVRHGYWIERYGVHEGKYYKCSACNYNCSHTKENYCSYCGAKMDVERRTDG